MINSNCDSIYEDANSKIDPKFFDDSIYENENKYQDNNNISNQETINNSSKIYKSPFRLKHNIKPKIEIPKSNSSNGRGVNYPYTPPISYHDKQVDKGCCKENNYCNIF